MFTSGSQRGFTLVEITMVIVIVTLLLGGVMRGQELVTQARIRDIVNDLSGVTAAYNFYYDRYKGVPGDDALAKDRWGPFGAKSGGGNGSISGKYFDNTAPSAMLDDDNDESSKFWWHLRLAGFIAGPASGPGATAPPSNSVGGIIGVQTSGLGLTRLLACESNVPVRIAGVVDAQMDDQRPDAGSVRAYEQSTVNEDVMGKAPNKSAYVESGSGQYVICKTL